MSGGWTLAMGLPGAATGARADLTLCVAEELLVALSLRGQHCVSVTGSVSELQERQHSDLPMGGQQFSSGNIVQ